MPGPLHVRTIDEWASLVHDAMESGDTSAMEDIVPQAFHDHHEDEEFTAWLTGVAFGANLGVMADLMRRHVELFPASIHPVRVDAAEMLLAQGKIDEGSNEARAYLKILATKDFAAELAKSEITRQSAARAFLMMTAVSTEVGARSYSLRVLAYALEHEFGEYWNQRLRGEAESIRAELQDPRNQTLDAPWEAFYASGEGEAELVELCRLCRLPITARRVVILAEEFREKPEFKIGREEILQLVYQTPDGAFVLH